ncbi:unnamed protein product [Cuscuta campestris]|uniref:Homeobox domain-containing protein n=1 Tax=Cuscuta campestris TaxID=132261 RepID=A0A484NKV4_9ASTE|nr:unnamed protein product [Cuscuta campestris]
MFEAWMVTNTQYTLGLLIDDKEFIEGIKEAVELGSGNQLRKLFVTLLVTNAMSRPCVVWEKTWELLADGILYDRRRLLRNLELTILLDNLQNLYLIEIEKLLNSNGRSLKEFSGMPFPVNNPLNRFQNNFLVEELNYDREKLSIDLKKYLSTMNDDQRKIYDEIMQVVTDVSAYIQCRKVAAPPQISTLLEEISHHPPAAATTTPTADEIAGDPELDQFMESYCEAMYKYKEELSKPFDEAKAFLSSIESQLSSLCKDSSLQTTSFNSSFHSCDEGGGGDTSEEEEEEEYASHGEVEVGDDGDGERQLAQIKEMLMRKYSGYLSNLRKDFLKKRKKGKLPKDARLVLLQWWDSHYRWPYPTEEEKNKLCEMTGLDQKQINNWFINQRKRHWRPSEGMRFALMEGLSNRLACL